MRSKKDRFRAILIVGALPLLSACSTTLETGYKFNRLDMTDTEQRGMYADPYSVEALKAQQDQQQDNTSSSHRPVPGGQY